MCLSIVCLQIALGASHFTTGPDGVWYQSEFAHTIHTESATAAIGLSGDNWRAGYQYLGRVTSTALASASDSDHNWPLSHFDGHGYVDGLYAAWVPRWIEIGAYAYRARWQEHIPDWRHCADCAPVDLTVTHRPTWDITPYVGVHYGPVAITYRHDIRARSDAWPAVYSGPVWTAELRLAL